MAIKMIASLAGDGFSLAPGDVPTQFSDKEERRLIRAGLAEKHEPDVYNGDEVQRLQDKVNWQTAELQRLSAENQHFLGEIAALQEAAKQASGEPDKTDGEAK